MVFINKYQRHLLEWYYLEREKSGTFMGEIMNEIRQLGFCLWNFDPVLQQ